MTRIRINNDYYHAGMRGMEGTIVHRSTVSEIVRARIDNFAPRGHGNHADEWAMSPLEYTEI